MKELAWIVATKRRDGKPPSIVKAAGDCDASFIFPVERDAQEYLKRLDARTPGAWAVFPVELSVQAPRT